MKRLLIKVRTSLKFIILISFATFLILGAVTLIYKPIYSVYFEGKLIGYCADKAKLQKQISDYVEKGNEDNNNLAYVSVDHMPTYKLCLLKRDIETSDEEIFEKIKTAGTSYYKYFAILDGTDEQAYFATYKEAEDVLKELKSKNSNNINDLSIAEKYETELKNFTTAKDAINKLYEQRTVVIAKTTSRESTTSRSSSYSGKITAKSGLARGYVDIGITLIKPVTGIITSRFGAISSIRSGPHTGLDIGTSLGTPIKAAASGTVSYSGWRTGGLGNLVVIDHGNGVQTYYAHCSKRYVSVGDKVSQGDKIAAVGSTGNSTGPHLHLEVRVNGVAYNPQKYVY